MIKNLVFSIEDTSTGATIYPWYSIGEMYFGVTDFLTDKEEGEYNFIEVVITETEEGFEADIYDKDIVYNHNKENVPYKVTRFELVHTIHRNNDVEILVKSRDFVKEVLLYKQYKKCHKIDSERYDCIDYNPDCHKSEFELVKLDF